MPPNCTHPHSPPNPLKPRADTVWEKASALSKELDRFRDAYKALTRHCKECVTTVELERYLHCIAEMDGAVSAFKRAKEGLEDEVVEVLGR